jgi:CheY-like chemotaxis protein
MVARRILIADDHAAVRRSVRSLLESHPEWELSGEATNGREAVEQARRLKPDVVLLDMTMPELNGLEATREILKEAPNTQVLLLTMYESEEFAEEAARAGARGVILKSGGDEMLARIESLSKRAMHIAGRIVEAARHIGVFLRSAGEFKLVLGQFVAEGLAQGEKAVHIIDPPNREDHERRLKEAGVDVGRAISQGHLELHSWDDMYLLGGTFDKNAMIARIEKLMLDRIEQGYPLQRLVAHMEWALKELPGVADLAEYEAELNNLLPRFDDVVVCVYDLSKFPASTIEDVLRSHPGIVIAGALHTNPFYTQPDVLVEEIHRRESSDAV